MRIWVPIAAALVLAATFLWTMRARVPVPRSGHADPQPVAAPGALPAHLPLPTNSTSTTPPPVNHLVPRPLDGKVVFHVVSLPEGRTGCRVEFMAAENGLAKSGVKEGDVITEVAGEPMSTRLALALVGKLEQASLTGIDLTILRDGKTQHVEARIGQ